MKLPKAIFFWSGGKDSAYCLYKILSEKTFDVKYLLTMVNGEDGRISMHGVGEQLLDYQAESIGIPILKVRIADRSNVGYEKKIESILLEIKSEEIDNVIFGDVFLDDLRMYRENILKKVGMTGIFPLWKMNTKTLLKEFVSKKFEALICCTNDKFLGEEWIGRKLDESFCDQLPVVVDPCGENGEYHTFCYDGPLFKTKIDFSIGNTFFKRMYIRTDNDCQLPSSPTNGFWFCDLIPVHVANDN